MDMPDHLADHEISRALTGGESDIDWAIEQICRKHESRLYAFAYRRLRDHHAAQEAVQDTLVAVLRTARRRKWRVDIHIENFLNRVLKNIAIGMFRKRQRHNRHLSDTPLEEQKNLPTVSPDVVWGGIVQKEEQVEEKAAFDEFVSSLKGKQKIVAQIFNDFFQRHGHKPTMQEIADEMKRRGHEDANKKSVQSIMRELRRKRRK